MVNHFLRQNDNDSTEAKFAFGANPSKAQLIFLVLTFG